MANSSELSLGETLLKQGVISQDILNEAMKKHEQTGEPLVLILSRLRSVKEDDVLKTISSQHSIPLIKLRDFTIDKSLIKKIPIRFVAHYRFIPIKLERNILTIASPIPYDLRTKDEMRLNLGYEIALSLASRLEVMDAIKKYYGLAADTIEKIMTQSTAIPVSQEITSDKVEEIEKSSEDASVIKLVNQIILEAHKSRATDIHIEPYRGKIRLRYRVDGVLFDANVPPAIRNFFSAIISRIKIISNLNIVERRLPQDGRCVVKTDKETLDLRISIIPTPYGESIVIRLLPMTLLHNLSDLGLNPVDTKVIENLLEKPHGIIFVTGPTGSGKTTTLYSSLNKLNTNEVKIITIEDPVEYEMEGITQIQVNPEIGLTFAMGLRSILRHDPDVIMVGEVRDFETAEITIRLALTGHLVFSTLHTNDAAGGVTRLIDMGVEPYLIASSVEAFVAQRLVRVICPDCREEDKSVLPEVVAQITRELRAKKQVTVYRGKGCETCNFTGYHGRTALYEIMILNEAIKKLILVKSSSDDIRRVALRYGMKTLRLDGWEKVSQGVTTPEEVLRVTPAEEVVEEKPKEATKPEPEEVATPAPQSKPTAIKPRTYQRIRSRIPIEYTVYKKSMDSAEELTAKPVKSVATDISAGGISFDTKELLAIGSILKLNVEVPEHHTKIDCMMRVVRISESKATGRYTVAAYYLDIASDDKAILDQYVTSQQAEEEPAE
ncbi:MAG: Flp pilus assembly complex ATPase component TadA [Planctomycetes bacterium]|nr:Flp pilus assembly complex ATPase component TadA [Planctomycetota bacterium]